MNNLVLFLERNRDWAPLIIRVGLAVVFLLFGFQKLSNPAQTTAEIQLLMDFLNLAAAAAINFYLGLTELVVALGLLLGVRTRAFGVLAALLLFLFLVSFLWKLGVSINPDLYRDVGLIGASIALVFLGGGKWSWDSRSLLNTNQYEFTNK